MENTPSKETDVRLFPRMTLDEWMQLRYSMSIREVWRRGIKDVKPLC